MITNKQIDFLSYRQSDQPNHLDILSRAVIIMLQLCKKNTEAYKLAYYEKMTHYIQVIGLYIFSTNSHIKLTNSHFSSTVSENYEERVSQSLSDFLIHFEIIQFQKTKPVINPQFNFLFNENRIEHLVKNNGSVYSKHLNKKQKCIIHNFYFVCDLVQKYNKPNYVFKHITGKEKAIWESLVINRKLDYEIRLSETLLNLIDIRIPQKIESPFSEDYYTESGQSAFNNFTRFLFLDYLKKIIKDNNTIQIFDLGCGYGNYIDILHHNFPDSVITGIEKNTAVFTETEKKFSETKTVEIINNDIFEYESDKKYDIILMNYVLFYFDLSGKQNIMEKAKNMLTDDGCIILCQYFSGIETMKKELAIKQKEYSIAKKIIMHYSNKILYANTLWNDAVDTFAEAVKWNEFKKIVTEADLYIASMTNADPFYYSLFVEIKKNKG